MRSDISRSQLSPGEALLAAGLGKEALPYLIEALGADPKSWRHLSNLASGYRICGDLDNALTKLTEALEINQEIPEVWNNLSNVLADLGDFDNSYKAALNSFKLLRSRHSAMTLGAALLRRGDWDDGGSLYDSGRIGYSWVPINGIPIWNGEDPAGKEILVLPEGGYGDSFWTLQFMREAVRRGAHVTHLTWPEQMGVLGYVDFPLTLLDREKAFDARKFDYQTATLSLLFRLSWHQADIKPVGRIIDIPEAYRESAKWLLHNGARKKVGICWYAEENCTARKFRSVRTEDIEHLRQLNCRWISLVQSKACPEWIEAKPLATWMDTAAIISELDLVVSVDTAVAHLAGCLGVPCLTLLPLNVDWRWGMAGEHSMWYESMTVIRNTDPLSFKPAITQVAERVSEWLAI